MTMLLSRKELINGVDPKLAKSIAQACSGEWQAPSQRARQCRLLMKLAKTPENVERKMEFESTVCSIAPSPPSVLT